MFDVIWSFLEDVWEYIKKIYVRVINFFNNIISFFKERNRLEKLRKHKEYTAVAIKQKFENGDYNVVNCIFDKEEGRK